MGRGTAVSAMAASSFEQPLIPRGATRVDGPGRHGCHRRADSGASGRSGRGARWWAPSAAVHRTPSHCRDAHHRRTNRGGCGRSCRADAPRPEAATAQASGLELWFQASCIAPLLKPLPSLLPCSDRAAAAAAAEPGDRCADLCGVSQESSPGLLFSKRMRESSSSSRMHHGDVAAPGCGLIERLQHPRCLALASVPVHRALAIMVAR